MKAMILAAGRGERMRPLTDHTPKPLLKVGGKPLIVWHIENLAKAGFKHIVINHAHLGQQIEDALQDGRQWDVQIQYSAEQTALETAGGIANALHLLTENGKNNAPFLVVNGDTFSDIDFAALSSLARKRERAGGEGESPPTLSTTTNTSSPFKGEGNPQQLLAKSTKTPSPLRGEGWGEGGQQDMSEGQMHKTLAHLVLVNNPPQHPNGDFSIQNGWLKNTGELMLTFSGVGVYHPDLFAEIERGQPAKLAPLLREAIEKNAATAQRHTGVWHDIGTPERLEQLDNDLLNHNTKATK